jgi:hypothetical protein
MLAQRLDVSPQLAIHSGRESPGGGVSPVVHRGTRQGDPTFVWIAVALAVIGTILLFIARLPLYRQGKFFTFGSKALSPGHRKVYRIAYGFIGVSVAMMLALLIVLR